MSGDGWLRGRGYVEHSNQWLGPDFARPITLRTSEIAMVEIVEPADGPRCLRVWLRTGVSVIVFQAPPAAYAEHFPHIDPQVYEPRPMLPPDVDEETDAGTTAPPGATCRVCGLGPEACRCPGAWGRS